MGSLLERQADRLASRSSRRGFMKVTAKLTAVVAGLGFGLSSVYNASASCIYACCTLAERCFCSTCPSCPSYPGKTAYGWSCCSGSCTWQCLECRYTDRTHNCACANKISWSGACGACPSAPEP